MRATKNNYSSVTEGSYFEFGRVVASSIPNRGCLSAFSSYMSASLRAKNQSQREADISLTEADMPSSTERSASCGLRDRAETEKLTLRMPCAEDGHRVSSLIASSPPLDVNSAYCNLLQCTDFRETCVVAERGGPLLGWISAYRPPHSPDELFVWQVAVDPAARGEGLAGKMLDALLSRPAVAGVRALTTTVTEDNEASWGVFRAFARRHGATLTRSPRFEREAHFAGAHETEWEARITPLPSILT